MVDWFLIILALVWIVVAVIQDIRKREVANWWNFSLIAIALAYRAFLSALFLDYRYFLSGLAGFAIFFALAYAFYYGRIFAGGDAKLLMGLGCVIGFSLAFLENLETFIYFIVLLLICGAVYGLLYSLALSYKDREAFSKGFLKQLKQNKRLILVSVVPAIILAVFFLIMGHNLFLLLPLVIFLFPFIYTYAKAIEESCMVKKVAVRKLTEGDWLYREIKVGRKRIKPSWEGLSSEEVAVLRKSKKKILIKQGIPFTPAFLLAFIVLLLLRNSNWNLWQLF